MNASPQAFEAMLDLRLAGALAKRISECARESPTPAVNPAQTPEQKQAEADEEAARLLDVPKGTRIL